MEYPAIAVKNPKYLLILFVASQNLEKFQEFQCAFHDRKIRSEGVKSMDDER